MNVPYREGVHKMYRQSRLVEKFDLLKVQNNKNSMEKYVRQMYKSCFWQTMMDLPAGFQKAYDMV